MEKKKAKLEKKGKQFWKKKRKKKQKKKKGKLGKQMKKCKTKKRKKTLWITIVIHSDLGVEKQ